MFVLYFVLVDRSCENLVHYAVCVSFVVSQITTVYIINYVINWSIRDAYDRSNSGQLQIINE